MKAAEIREKFLKYFEKNGHTIVESSALVPQNDPTLLFTNAGMVQFKDVFLGKDPRPYKRATSSQKCLRAGGKHNDLENVGFTARHHTFFEMLGNFSFGDYFKKDAIRFAWEFVTQVLKLPKDRLYVTVFKDDDEAADIWHKQEGVPKDRIFRFGEKDNFWSMGDTGPCGPCSELFIDRGEKHGCKKPDCKVGCDCDRFMEFWNLVFMQFNRDETGKLTPLPKPSVDTGAGLERIASILQNVDTNYDTDLFHEIMTRTSQLTSHPYDPKSPLAASFRVIADHSRATTFLIADGVLPSNEGRGYVLRRIIRRAIRHGKKLGLNDPFLHKVSGFVIEQMKSAYPELVDKASFIEKAVKAEEEQFLRTLDTGLKLLDEEISKLGKSKTIPGDVAFKLYDTYGFPLDLTRVIAEEKSLTVDEQGFESHMEKQRSESRKHWKGSGEEAVAGIYHEVATKLKAANTLPEFSGYESVSDQGKCIGILVKKDDQWSSVDFYQAKNQDGELIQAIFSPTPFYAEGGGQVGDRGRITGNGFTGEVMDVQKPVEDLIVAHIRPQQGSLKVGSTYEQETHTEIRKLTARNHTATHLLHWALRKVLGTHVKQAGSLVSPDLLRFDFSHFQPLTPEELTSIENMINEKIWNAEPVSKKTMAKDEAVAAGAIAFFGEKYGQQVRVVKVGDFSVELCGGTHVDNSSDIHLFKIANENGIAAGVRRIVAYTSKGAFQYLRERDEEIKSVRNRLKASSTQEIDSKLEKLFSVEKELRKQIEKLQSQNVGSQIDDLIKNAQHFGETALVALICPTDSNGVKGLREMSDQLKQKHPNCIAVLGMKDQDKAFLLTAVGPKAPPQIKAQELLKELAPLIDGRGGGKPDLAQAGGTNPSGLDAAIQKAKELVSRALA